MHRWTLQWRSVAFPANPNTCLLLLPLRSFLVTDQPIPFRFVSKLNKFEKKPFLIDSLDRSTKDEYSEIIIFHVAPSKRQESAQWTKIPLYLEFINL